MRTTTCLLLAAASLSACKWTEFDDLQDQTWVRSTKKPNVKSSDYGVAIQRGGDGRLVVIGAGTSTYSELVFDAKGDSSLAQTTVDLAARFSIATFDPQPILLAAPDSDDVALIVNGGGSSITVLTGTQGNLTEHQVLIQPSTVDAATYMQAPNRATGEKPPLQPLIASGDFVVGTYYTNAPTPQPKCKLVDAVGSTTAIQAHALGIVPGAAGMPDDVLAWGASGKLARYPGSVFDGCATTREPIASIDTGFMPGHGSQILPMDKTHVVLQGHHEGDDASFLQVYDVSAATPSAVGGPVSAAKLRTAAIFDGGGAQYVIAGYPTAVLENKIAGQVVVFKLTATGLDPLPALTLFDVQPEANQSFGRAVAVMPFQGKRVIAVAADNEIFVYFRLQLADGTVLYDETRQVR